MRLQLNATELLGVKKDDVIVDVSNGEWLNSITSKLTNPELIHNITISDDFKATLRTYQQNGIDWLNYMKNLLQCLNIN